MYWNFLEDNKNLFEGNVRLAMPLRTLAKKSADAKQLSLEVTTYVRETLAKGERLDPSILESIKS